MIPVQQALKILEEAAEPLGRETVELRKATGRVLGYGIVADRDQPPTDRSAMDGFAVRVSDLSEPGISLLVVGEVPAGKGVGALAVGPGQAVRIMTGSVIPPGADAVVMVEQTEEDRASGTVRILQPPVAGQHIRVRGEEAEQGELLLEPGCRIRAAESATLASVGCTMVPVFQRPAVAVLSTGDEVVEPETVPEEHQVRNSNAFTLLAQLQEIGQEGTYIGIAPDDPDRLRERLREGLKNDLLILTGGVSAGKYDLVADVLRDSGMELLFHKVKIKPGKPILAGRAGRCIVLGLPGNPVSAFTGFAVFAAPLLRRIGGLVHWKNREVSARVMEPLPAGPDRTLYHLVKAGFREGEIHVRPAGSKGSGDVSSLARANAFAVTQGGRRETPVGSVVPVMLWNDLLA